ncbi:SusC/RagA family TonB-linked outer membrane protein [Flavobacterium eburneipallidum]|uniref:SusC/RagA family TonB-linked outer membrane protein n=1 Tax=Flavobacterium eburneipallidum TaxID=3003263 RepID=UPI00248256EA|nr:SusC/RagA family TonB-linked outer membrane protein [Flavobacterium eburneipallidum]
MNKFSHFKLWIVQELPKLYCLFFLCSLTEGYTQDKTITGILTDTNGVLPNVTVTVKSTRITTFSNLNGIYFITAAPTDVLLFSYIGYKTTEITINNRQTINLLMQEDTSMLQEVTINAGYYSVKDSERTGSIAKITSTDIEKQPVTNVLATMQGRMAGVNITQETGVPGGGFNIQIRGINSLRTEGNEPLYIIDGVPYASQALGYSQISTTIPGDGSPLNSINPNDIQSIEVLKDADATAIYGSRGANGVVLISTKKGKQGKTQFSINASKGSGRVTKTMQFMNTEQYLTMRRQAFVNDGITQYPDYEYDINGTWDHTRNTDWQKELIGGTAEIMGVQTSISGGSEQTQFLLSGTYNSETTVFPGDFIYKKAALHSNINHQSENKKFKLNFSANYVNQNNDQPWTDFTLTAMSLAPNAPALYDNQGNLNWENNTWDNPLANLEGKFNSKTGDIVANTLLSYQLFKNWELKSSFGYTNLHYKESRTTPSTLYNPAYNSTSRNSSILINNTNRQSRIIEPQINWKKEFGKLNVDLLLGGTFLNQNSDQVIVRGRGFTSNSLLYDLASATTITVLNNQETAYKYQAFFGRINWKWQDKYILNATGRRDGSSRFGPGKQFANFGAIGTAWLFSNEQFLKNNTSLFSFGKLRASYGTTGNDQIGDYQFMDTYSSSGSSYQSVVGLQPSRLFNSNYGWETNTKLEIALETGFLEDRIFFTWAWYNNQSSNQLVGIPLPATTGFSSLQANLDATVQNSGIEITLRTTNIQSGGFNWTTNFNLTVPKNKLISFPELESSTYANQYVVGQSINIQKLYNNTGLNSQTGIYGFEDVNGDGQITYPDDSQTIRDFSPKYFGGLQNHLEYKGWQLDFLFQFVKQENFNWAYMAGLPGAFVNQSVYAADSWQKPGDTNPNQQYSTGVNNDVVEAYYKYISSNAAVSDASFIRLKNIAISYDIPKSWIKELQCKMYVQGQNLLLFTPYKGADPEFRSAGYLPPLKVITAGIQLNF